MGKLRIAIAAVTVAASIGSMSPSLAAGSRTVTYVAAPGARCCNQLDPTSAGVGGFQFNPPGDPTQIRIVDVDGAGVVWIACQEGPGSEGETPGTCGDGDDASAGDCSTNAFQNLSTAFKPGIPLTVFILTANPGVFEGPDCPQPAVAGEITLKWA